MAERNYWTRMRRNRMSRRGLLKASARAGVGAAGLALVGCGDDDDDDQPASAAVQQQQQQEQQAAQVEQQAEQQAGQQQAQTADRWQNSRSSRPPLRRLPPMAIPSTAEPSES